MSEFLDTTTTLVVLVALLRWGWLELSSTSAREKHDRAEKQLASEPVEFILKVGDKHVRYLREDAVKIVMHGMLLHLAAVTAHHVAQAVFGITRRRNTQQSSTVTPSAEQSAEPNQ